MDRQDAGEFLAHLFQVATRAHAKALTRPDSKKNKPFRNFVDLFSFHIERRTQCGQSGKVRYTIEPEQTIGMSVPMDNAKVKPEAEGENDDQSGGAAKKIKLDENKVDNIEDAPLAPPPAGEDQPDDVSVAESAAAPAPAPTPTSAKKVTYIVDFVDCLAAMKSPEVTADWMSPVCLPAPSMLGISKVVVYSFLLASSLLISHLRLGYRSKGNLHAPMGL